MSSLSKQRQARDRKEARILAHCKKLLQRYACDAQTIAAQCHLAGIDGVEPGDVRNVMKTPEALQAFDRVRSPIGRIEWVCKGQRGFGWR
tara:strand:+ start:3273 stop:3542 length:270 start_codon:yes stop_codon:yes gene_type:complete